MAVYEIGPSFAARIAAAARRRRVRVLLDDHEQGNARALPILLRAGVPVRIAGGPLVGRAHWKLLRSGTTVACGTGNLEQRGAPVDPAGAMPCAPPLPGTREWWVSVSAHPALLRAAADAFSQRWEVAPPAALGRGWRLAAEPAPPPVGPPPAVVAPLRVTVADRAVRLLFGGDAAAAEVERLASSARRRVHATVPYVHARAASVRAVLRALRAAAGRGADVRLLLGEPPAPVDAAALRAAGLAVRVMDPRRCTTGHAKGVVADSRALVTSSNWSAAGLRTDLEASVRIDGAAAADYLAKAHARDWEASTDLD